MSTLLISWPLKRAMIARLQAHADGSSPPPPGAELLASGDPEFDGAVQVEHVLPAEPSRLCVFGAPIRFSRTEMTAETPRQGGVVVLESTPIEIRCRVYAPGEDVTGVDRMLGNLLQAVAVALLEGAPFFAQGSMWLQSVTQDPTAVAPNPEPSVTTFASMIFQADVMTT